VLRADGADDERALPHATEAAPAGDPAVVELLRRSADRALRTGAPDTAAVHLRRALAEPPAESSRAEVLAELGAAEVRMGDFSEGLAHLDAALAGIGDPARRATAQRSRVFAAFAGSGMAAAREVVREAVADARAGGDGALELEADLSLLAWLSGGDHGLELERHRGVAGATPAERTILAVLAQETHSAGTDPDGAVELAERALGGGRLIAEDTAEALSWYMATYTLLSCEANDAARGTIDAALADARRRGSAFAHAGALGARAVLALNEGRPRDAEADARNAAEGAIPPIMRPVNASYLVLALVDQGDLEGAEAELAAAGLATGPGGPTVLRWIPWARARLREAQGDAAAAREAVDPIAEDDDAARPMRALAWRALLARAIGRDAPAEAAELAAAHLGWARGWGRPAALGVALRADALSAPAGDAPERLAGAVDVLAGSALRTEEARARADLGVRLLRAGERRAGREELERALEVAIACGCRGVARAVADELEVAGAKPRRVAFDELTASERRVAELAASGRTNREIADELFVTPKTVENHLTRVYAKLGLRTRRDLAGAL
jgi:DNA-binding CsgD family transcriptional regulator